MKKYIIHLLYSLFALSMLSSCADVMEGVDTSRQITLTASMPIGENTNPTTKHRVSATQQDGTLNLITKWEAGDKVKIYVTQDNKTYSVGEIQVADISDNGKSCSLLITLPTAVDPQKTFTITGLVDVDATVTSNGEIYATCDLKRTTLDNPVTPMWFRVTGADQCFNAEFKHLGTYEVLHVKNKTNSPIKFTHYGYQTQTPWYKKTDKVLIGSTNPQQSTTFTQGESYSPTLTIPAHGEKAILSWYIPSGASVSNAKLIAHIEGNTGGAYLSQNAKTSDVTLQRGHAYHLYVEWDGQKLIYTDDGIDGNLTVSRELIDFGDVAVGSTVQKSFYVENVGTAPVTFRMNALDGVFNVVDGGQNITINPTERKEFSVQYTPNKEGETDEATITIYVGEVAVKQIALCGKGKQNTAETKTFTVNGVSFTMVGVEGGTFWMGAADDDTEAGINEKPRHEVTLSSFYISKYEVTQELWQAVMGENPSRFTGNLKRPVEEVSWNKCQEFISKLNAQTGQQFRLPTEAEWEYAARGGKKSKGYLYSGSNDINDVAWYDDNSSYTTHPVGQKRPNELGLYDMSGNVREWCQDWFGVYPSAAQTNPKGPSTATYRVGRGGSCYNYAWLCRVSYRTGYAPGYGDTPVTSNHLLGLRLVL